MFKLNWPSVGEQQSKSYTCGYCGESVASNKGFTATYIKKINHSDTQFKSYIYICHFCKGPTFFDPEGRQHPGAVIGSHVKHLPENVKSLYLEARKCYAVSAYTASVLCSRKILMNIAQTHGAEANKNFQFYVNWLKKENYLPPKGKSWIDHIRKKGNEATHEIPAMEEKDAQRLITFLEMLLKFLYEYPEEIK